MMKTGAQVKIRDLNRLTAAEERIYALFKKGLSRREIAESLGLKYGTINATLKIIFEKTDGR
jgi:DNA-binding CsgD family transcriptional regulator